MTTASPIPSSGPLARALRYLLRTPLLVAAILEFVGGILVLIGLLVVIGLLALIF